MDLVPLLNHAFVSLGNVSVTLRHRLDCSLKTESLVPTNYQMDACSLDPVGKKPVRFTPRKSLHTDDSATKKRMNVSSGGESVCVCACAHVC